MLILTALFAIGFFSRFFLVEKMQSHWDGPQYSIAVVRYSLLQQTPALPGYPIYIGFAKLFNTIFHDPHYSIVFLSVLFSGLGACIFYLAGRIFFNSRVGIIAGFLFLSSPVFYFFGITANPYGIVGINSVIFALITYQMTKKRRKWGIIYGLLFSYVIGFRPQEIVFLIPLWLYGINTFSPDEKIKSFFSFGVGSFLWLYSMAVTVGGIPKYIQLVLNNIFQTTNESFITHEVNIIGIILKGLFLAFGVSIIIPFLKFSKLIFARNLIKDKRVVIFVLWIITSFVFNLFIRSDHAAHQVTYLSGLLILISLSIYLTTKKFSRPIVFICMFIIVAFNLFTFFRNRDPYYSKPYIPQSYHYSEIQKNDKRMSAKISYIKNNTKDSNTLILIGEPDYIRPVMYYLPQYTIIQITRLVTEEMRFKNVIRIAKNFDMEEKQSSEKKFMIPNQFTNIVCFDDNCGAWMNQEGIKLDGNSSLVSKPIFDHKIIYSFHRIVIQ